MTAPGVERPPGDFESGLLSAILALDSNPRVWVGGHNVALRRSIDRALQGCSRPPEGDVDAAILTPESLAEAVYFAQKARSRLSRHAALVVVVSRGLVDRDGPMDRWTSALTRLGYAPHDEHRVSVFDANLVLRFLPVRTG